jgi:hypothetical protein
MTKSRGAARRAPPGARRKANPLKASVAKVPQFRIQKKFLNGWNFVAGGQESFAEFLPGTYINQRPMVYIDPALPMQAKT